MRRFKIVNKKGQEFDLNRTDAFLTIPERLGVENELIYQDAGRGYINLKSKPNQKNPKGVISFADYEQFDEFVQIIRHPPLEFKYSPTEKWYTLICDLEYLKKSEISQDTGRLECDISLKARGLWQEETQVYEVGELPSEGSKTYTYEYPCIYRDNAIGTVTIVNDTEINQPCRIEITGPATNPAWVVYKDGVAKATGLVNDELSECEKLIVDNTDPSNYEIAVYSLSNDFIRDVYALSDFSTTRFVELVPGQNLISFSNALDEPKNVKVFVRKERNIV